LTAAIALLKLGDGMGTAVLEDALRRGAAEEAYEVKRLVYHSDVSERERKRVDTLIHLNHLHYPEHLPVTEPLRVRLCEVPRECLKDLSRHYTRAQDAAEAEKIKRALESLKKFPPVKGDVVLVGLDEDWREMASVALLAHGYKVRVESDMAGVERDDFVVGFEEVAGLGPESVVLTVDANATAPNRVVRTHYAPSKLIAALAHVPRSVAKDADANPFTLRA